MILPRPFASPLPSFCSNAERELPRSLAVREQMRRLAIWIQAQRRSAQTGGNNGRKNAREEK
jgi:hypothetical protein